MRVGRGSWHVLRLHVPRAAACAANDRMTDPVIVIGSFLYYSNAQNWSFRHACRVPRLTFLDAQGVPRHCHRT